jgi:hypothetical protein
MKGLRQENSDLKRELDDLRNRSDMDESLRVVDRSHLLDEDFDSDVCRRENKRPDVDSTVSPPQRRTVVSRYHSSLNRNPLADRPAAPIKQDDIDLDDDFCSFPTYKSDWALPSLKKRKMAPEDGQSGRQGPPFPLKLDSKGHAKGTVQLGSKMRMGK